MQIRSVAKTPARIPLELSILCHGLMNRASHPEHSTRTNHLTIIAAASSSRAESESTSTNRHLIRQLIIYSSYNASHTVILGVANIDGPVFVEADAVRSSELSLGCRFAIACPASLPRSAAGDSGDHHRLHVNFSNGLILRIDHVDMPVGTDGDPFRTIESRLAS